jgi:hypothetical protein
MFGYTRHLTSLDSGSASDTVTFGDIGGSLTPPFLLLFWRVSWCLWDFEVGCRILADRRCGHISFWQLQVTVF